jgi:hypothetical protein
VPSDARVFVKLGEISLVMASTTERSSFRNPCVIRNGGLGPVPARDKVTILTPLSSFMLARFRDLPFSVCLVLLL